MHVQYMMRRLIAAPSGFVGLPVLLAVALTLPSPAAAVLTSQEATALQRPFAAARNLSSGISGALLPAIKDQTNTSTRPKLATVAQLIVRAQGQLAGGIADLLGGSAADDDGRGRTFFVRRGMEQLTSAHYTLTAAKSAVNAAIAAGASSYYLGRLRDIDIAGALVNLQAFDTTLRFADPYPAARSPQGRMLVIGPHGDYDEAQRRLTSATTFLLAATAAVVDAYKSDSLLPSYWSLYQQLKFAGTLYQQNIEAMATLAGLSQNATEAARSPFFRILGRIETLTHGGGGPCHPDDCHGTPYQYNNFMQFTLSQVSYWAGRPSFAHYQQEAMHRITEAWDATDSAVWYMLTFPECDQRSTPRGCGGTR
jgi:hypothetical protein